MSIYQPGTEDTSATAAGTGAAAATAGGAESADGAIVDDTDGSGADAAGAA